MLKKYPLQRWFFLIATAAIMGSLALGVWTVNTSIKMITQAILTQQKSVALSWATSEPRKFTDTDTRLTLIDSNGTVLKDSHFDTLPLHQDRQEIQDALSGKIGYAHRFSKSSKDMRYYVAFPFYNGQAASIGAVRLAMPGQVVEETEKQILQKIWPFYVLFIGGMVVLIFLAHQQNSRSLQKLAKNLNTLSEAKIRQLSDNPTPEIKEACLSLAEQLTTSNKEKNSALEEKKAILDNLKERVLLVGPSGDIVHVNISAAQLFPIPAHHTVHVSQACRNSTFLEIISHALAGNVVTNKRIFFNLPDGNTCLQVTGIPVMLNSVMHALMLLSEPTYTWMPAYTRLLQLWLDSGYTVENMTRLRVLNETLHTLCTNKISPKTFSIAQLCHESERLGIVVNDNGSTTTILYTDMHILLGSVIAITLAAPKSTIAMITTESTVTLTATVDTTTDPSLFKFLEALSTCLNCQLIQTADKICLVLKSLNEKGHHYGLAS